MVKKDIFISSTYLDLKDYREELWKKITDEIGTVVNIRGMEAFGARTKKPIDTCLGEVSESDVFVLICGMRYGNDTSNSEGISFVESEYLKAQSEGLETLIFLLDEEKGCVIPNTIDFHNYEKLKEFKKRIKRNHTIEFFSNKDELALKTIRALKFLFNDKKWPLPYDTSSNIIAKISLTTVRKGDEVEIVGIVDNNIKSVCMWIFGEDRYLTKKALVNSKTGSFSFTIPPHITRCFECGQYFVLIQHPGRNNLYDVFDVCYGNCNVLINSISKTKYIFKGKNAIFGLDAALALIDLINTDGIDDSYVKLSFTIDN